MLVSPFPHAFGLDISDTAIKLVQLYNTSVLYNKPHYTLSAARTVELPPGLIVDGDIQQPEPVRSYVQKILQGNKKKDAITSPWVVASVPEKRSFLKLITLPKSPDTITEEDVIALAKQHVPFEQDSYYLDWQIITSTPLQETTVLLAVTSRQVADMYTYLLESVGLGVIALEIESLAMARSMITAQKIYDGEARMILDIGSSKTICIVYDNNSIQFSTVLPYSGDGLTRLIQEKLNITESDAEKKKMSSGLKHGPGKPEKMWQLLMRETTQLIHDIEKSINFYYSHFPQANRITHITMCGGGSLLPQLDAVLAEKLNLSIRAGLPWKNLSPKKPINVPETTGLRYSAAIGLALRAADNPFFRYDTI